METRLYGRLVMGRADCSDEEEEEFCFMWVSSDVSSRPEEEGGEGGSSENLKNIHARADCFGGSNMPIFDQ